MRMGGGNVITLTTTCFGQFLLSSSATARYHGLPVIMRYAGRRVRANCSWVSEFLAQAAAYSLRNPDSRVVLQFKASSLHKTRAAFLPVL
jgi:hypothetical protein